MFFPWAKNAEKLEAVDDHSADDLAFAPNGRTCLEGVLAIVHGGLKGRFSSSALFFSSIKNRGGVGESGKSGSRAG